MGFRCGIIGLPNVGKSSLFNALLGLQKASAENYPFCTIEPNVGKVPVPDKRLIELGKISKSKNIINTQIEFVDIAGLVKGASNGEGLGNKFLANIREVDIIAHLVRCFDNDKITHVNGKIDPISDVEIIETELMFSDIEMLTKKISKYEKEIMSGNKDSAALLETAKIVLEKLNNGELAKNITLNTTQKEIVKNFNLLTFKPAFLIANVDEDSLSNGNEFSRNLSENASQKNMERVIISAKLEEEISVINDNNVRKEILKDLNIKSSGLERVIKVGYKLLQLVTFYFSGPNQSRAWTIPQNTTAVKAAGKIHSDFERGFIAADTIKYEDFINHNGERNAKEKGLIKTEGKNYIVNDGDIILFKFNV